MAEEKKEENEELFPDAKTSQEGSNQSSSAGEDQDKGQSRMDAAKAFFRAMYAGDSDSESGSNEAETNTSPPPSTSSAGQGGRVSHEMAALQERLREAEGKVAEAEALYKRMAADFENYRRRIDREREELMSHGTKKTIELLLPALDDLDRALSVLRADTPVDKVVESFKLVASRIVSCLEQAGVTRLVTEGQIFDPKYHEPVQSVPSTELPDGSIIQELRGGYMLNDKVVRPALVNVAVNDGESVPPQNFEDNGSEDAPQDALKPEVIDDSFVDEAPESKKHSKKKNKKADDEDSPSKVYELDSLEEK